MAEQVMKKEWTEPELIVLVRNKPEEAVLRTCKLDPAYGDVTIAQGCRGGISCIGKCELQDAS